MGDSIAALGAAVDHDCYAGVTAGSQQHYHRHYRHLHHRRHRHSTTATTASTKNSSASSPAHADPTGERPRRHCTPADPPRDGCSCSWWWWHSTTVVGTGSLVRSHRETSGNQQNRQQRRRALDTGTRDDSVSTERRRPCLDYSSSPPERRVLGGTATTPCHSVRSMEGGRARRASSSVVGNS